MAETPNPNAKETRSEGRSDEERCRLGVVGQERYRDRKTLPHYEKVKLAGLAWHNTNGNATVRAIVRLGIEVAQKRDRHLRGRPA